MRMPVRIYANTCTHIFIYARIYAYMCAYMHMHSHTCAYICACTPLRIRTVPYPWGGGCPGTFRYGPTGKQNQTSTNLLIAKFEQRSIEGRAEVFLVGHPQHVEKALDAGVDMICARFKVGSLFYL